MRTRASPTARDRNTTPPPPTPPARRCWRCWSGRSGRGEAPAPRPPAAARIRPPDIDAALAWCEGRIDRPERTHLVLVSDLYEGGNARDMLARVGRLKRAGVNVIVLLALSDQGHPAYDANHAGLIAAMDCPVFACTPDLFPGLMAAALTRKDIARLAAGQDIATIRPREEG